MLKKYKCLLGNDFRTHANIGCIGIRAKISKENNKFDKSYSLQIIPIQITRLRNDIFLRVHTHQRSIFSSSGKLKIYKQIRINKHILTYSNIICIQENPSKHTHNRQQNLKRSIQINIKSSSYHNYTYEIMK